MKNTRVQITGILFLSGVLVLAGCKSQTASREGAKKGAVGGAFTGAVGGFFWGLITGNPIKGAAKGAAVGAGTGAVVGGVYGGKTDKELKAQFGEINYEALTALIYRDYDLAWKKVKLTENDPNLKYRHASAWVSALLARETLSSDEMEPFYDRLIELDGDIESREDAKVEVRLAQRDLKSLRSKFNAK